MSEFYRDNSITIWIAAFAVQIAMGMLAQAVAERKGHSKRWFWAGSLLPLAGVIWAAGLPDETLRAEMREMREKRDRNPGIAPCFAAAAEPISEECELAAVLAAAVEAFGEQQGAKYVLRSFRPAGAGSTAWNRREVLR